MRRSLIVAAVAVIALAGIGYVGWRAYQSAVRDFTPEVCSVPLADGTFTSLSAEQARNAAIIVAASIERGLPERAAVVALATAYQESDIRNLDYGDRDSLGLFQQRPSYGWGTEEQIMDPWYASNRFYEELVKFTDWESTDVNDMAQKVQRSGFPEAYRQHEQKAFAVAAALRGTSQATLACLSFAEEPSSDLTALERAVAVWGDTVELTKDAATVTLTSDDEVALWSATHLAVANSYDAGITSAVVGTREWKADEKGWHEADEPVAAGTAVITLG